MFESADVHSLGESERVLGQAIKGRRDKLLISTKAAFRFGDGANDIGSSRQHLITGIDGALKRLGADYIDLFQLHGFDAFTPAEEVLATLDTLVRAGKIRYVGVSNFSGWHLMKSLAIAEKYGFSALRGQPDLLFIDWSRLRMGVDAARRRPRGWRGHLVTSRFRPPYGCRA